MFFTSLYTLIACFNFFFIFLTEDVSLYPLLCYYR